MIVCINGRGTDVCVDRLFEMWKSGTEGTGGGHYQQGGHQLEHRHKLELHRAPDRVACMLPAISHCLPQHSQCFVPQGLQRDAGAESGRCFCHPRSWRGSHETGR